MKTFIILVVLCSAYALIMAETQPLVPKVPAVDVPPKVQQVVTQVSQHIPSVINQHVSKQRLVRSPSHRSLHSVVAQYHIGQHQISAEQQKKCDFKCTGYDMPVCGYNGRCYREFESQCSLSKHNCLNTNKTFRTVDEHLCQDTTTTKCYQGDM